MQCTKSMQCSTLTFLLQLLLVTLLMVWWYFLSLTVSVSLSFCLCAIFLQVIVGCRLPACPTSRLTWRSGFNSNVAEGKYPVCLSVCLGSWSGRCRHVMCTKKCQFVVKVNHVWYCLAKSIVCAVWCVEKSQMLPHYSYMWCTCGGCWAAVHLMHACCCAARGVPQWEYSSCLLALFVASSVYLNL